MDELKRYIREIPDFPKPGITFYDITTLLKDPLGLRETVDRFTWRFLNQGINKVVGIESRGFIFGPAVALSLAAGFVPVRKPGKLPAATRKRIYDLEYGSDSLEMHVDAVGPGDVVLIVDDLIATGGTARAVVDLIEESGAEVLALGFIVELSFLDGRSKLDGRRIESLIEY